MFDTELSYWHMMEAIRTRKGFDGTIEFFPEEGKYHYDGHRACGVCCAPKETIAAGYRCRACGKRLTVGVMHRVEVLADREPGFRPSGASPFRSAVPLVEIIAEAKGVGAASRRVNEEYMKLLSLLGNEFSILFDRPADEIARASSSLVAEAITRMRAGKVSIMPGYDGEYGRVKIFDRDERGVAEGQGKLL